MVYRNVRVPVILSAVLGMDCGALFRYFYAFNVGLYGCDGWVGGKGLAVGGF